MQRSPPRRAPTSTRSSTADFPDPAVIHAPDGYYYAYATQTLRDGEWINIQVARSSDLIDWELLGDALPEKPAWARKTQDFWAPSVIFDGTTYFMYYSATPDVCHDHERGHALAVATSSSPAGPFVDMGMPLLLGAGFEYIDPMAYDDPVTGKHLLYWGSGFQPIKVQELSAGSPVLRSRKQRAVDLIWPNPARRRVSAAGRGLLGDPPRRFLLSVLLRRQLLRAGRRIWRDGRALRSATGPFETLEEAKGVPHSLMLFKSERWLAPGHNCIVTDKAGQSGCSITRST